MRIFRKNYKMPKMKRKFKQWWSTIPTECEQPPLTSNYWTQNRSLECEEIDVMPFWVKRLTRCVSNGSILLLVWLAINDKLHILSKKCQALSREDGWDPINRFNSDKFLCMSQAGTWISNAICHGPILCSIIWSWDRIGPHGYKVDTIQC
jgi:hypothetical protein